MFTVDKFTVAKIWKQSKCPLTDEWIKEMWCTQTHSHKIMQSCSYDNMDGSRGYDAQSVRERQIPQDLTYVWNLKHKTEPEVQRKNRYCQKCGWRVADSG